MTTWRRAQQLALAVALVTGIDGPATAQSRTARTVRFDSPALGSQATVAVLLPPGYDASETRYPVLYLLHGGAHNHTAFPARAWFAKEASRHDMIVVMPHLPPVFFTRRGDAPPAFEEFLARDLTAYVDAAYRTIPTPRGRGVAGISMGGFAATVVGLKHHDTFGSVGAISAALTGAGRQQQLDALVAALPAARAPYIYIACGAQDPVAPASRRLVGLHAARSIPHESVEVPGDHSWAVWDPQVQAFFGRFAARRQP
jgi:S-formylglutathione hydrolase FrmB